MISIIAENVIVLSYNMFKCSCCLTLTVLWTCGTLTQARWAAASAVACEHTREGRWRTDIIIILLLLLQGLTNTNTTETRRWLNRMTQQREAIQSLSTLFHKNLLHAPNNILRNHQTILAVVCSGSRESLADDTTAASIVHRWSAGLEPSMLSVNEPVCYAHMPFLFSSCHSLIHTQIVHNCKNNNTITAHTLLKAYLISI